MSAAVTAVAVVANDRGLVRVAPEEAEGAAWIPGSDVLRLSDERLRYLPLQAEQLATVPAGDLAALAAVASRRSWLARPEVRAALPGRAQAEQEAARRSLLFLRALLRPDGALLAPDDAPAPARPRDAALVAAAFERCGCHAEATAIARSLARTQGRHATWAGTADNGPARIEAAGWFCWAAWAVAVPSADRTLAAGLWPAVRRAAQAGVAALPGGELPDAWADERGRRPARPTLAAAAALRSGLRAAAAVAVLLGHVGDERRYTHVAGWVDSAIWRAFHRTREQRFDGPDGPDAAVTWLAPPFRRHDPALTAALASAATALASRGGGMVATRARRDADPSTCVTAAFALAAAAGGDDATARSLLAWLAAHRTVLGAFPDRVSRRTGAPGALAPCAATHALHLLTLASLEAPLPIP